MSQQMPLLTLPLSIFFQTSFWALCRLLVFLVSSVMKYRIDPNPLNTFKQYANGSSTSRSNPNALTSKSSLVTNDDLILK